MDKIVELFCYVDAFCQSFIPGWNKYLIETGLKKRNRASRLSESEIITIIILFHQMRFRDFKPFYLQYVKVHLAHYFPLLVSYTRFMALLKSVIVPLSVLMKSFSGKKTGVYFVDSMVVKVCHIKREKQHRVFRGVARKGKSSVGWFFGFKLHVVINHQGEIMAVKLTAANVCDREPVDQMTQSLTGKLFGDKGYISSNLSETLLQKGLHLITRIRKNMKNKLMLFTDKLLLAKRGIIESVHDQLKNLSQIEHSRHRSIWNFSVNLLAALVAYCLQPKKPSLHLKTNPFAC